LQTSFDKQVTRSAHQFYRRRIKLLGRTEDSFTNTPRSLDSE